MGGGRRRKRSDNILLMLFTWTLVYILFRESEQNRRSESRQKGDSKIGLMRVSQQPSQWVLQQRRRRRSLCDVKPAAVFPVIFSSYQLSNSIPLLLLVDKWTRPANQTAPFDTYCIIYRTCIKAPSAFFCYTHTHPQRENTITERGGVIDEQTVVATCTV